LHEPRTGSEGGPGDDKASLVVDGDVVNALAEFGVGIDLELIPLRCSQRVEPPAEHIQKRRPADLPPAVPGDGEIAGAVHRYLREVLDVGRELVGSDLAGGRRPVAIEQAVGDGSPAAVGLRGPGDDEAGESVVAGDVGEVLVTAGRLRQL